MQGWELELAGVGDSLIQNKNKMQLLEFLQLSWKIPNFYFMVFEDIDPILKILRESFDHPRGFFCPRLFFLDNFDSQHFQISSGNIFQKWLGIFLVLVEVLWLVQSQE